MGHLSDILAKLSADPSTSSKQDISHSRMGNLTDAAASASSDEDTTSRSMIALLKGQKNLLIDVQASLAALDTLMRTTGIAFLPMDADIDDIDVSKMSKGAVTTAHSAIAETATSAEIDCRGYNAILVKAFAFSAAENWTFKVQGSMTSGGTFVDIYEQANTGAMVAMSHQCNAAMMFPFRGIPDYVKIVATRDGGASTVTVKVHPFNG